MKKIIPGLALPLLFLILLLKPQPLLAESKLKLDIKFDRPFYTTTETVSFSAFVTNSSPETLKRNRVIFTVYGRLYDSEGLIDLRTKGRRALIRRYWFDNFDSGKTKFGFRKALGASGLSPGVYPVELVAELANNKIYRHISYLVIYDAQTEPLPTALVWEWRESPQQDPDGKFLDDRLARRLVDEGPDGYGRRLDLLESRQSLKVNLAISPILLDDINDLANGAKTGGRTVGVGESRRGAKEFLSRMRSLASDTSRLEILSAPYSMAPLPLLSREGWNDDWKRQMSRGATTLRDRLKIKQSGGGIFAPGLEVDTAAAERLTMSGGTYTIVRSGDLLPKPKSPITPTYKIASAKGRYLTVLAADQIASAIIEKFKGQGLATRLRALTLMRAQTPRRKPGTLIIVGSTGIGHESALVAGDVVSSSPWVRSDTLASVASAADPIAVDGRLKEYRPRSPYSRRYRSELTQNHRELTDFKKAVSEGNAVRKKLDEALLVAESIDFVKAGEQDRGLLHLKYIERAIERAYANISIAPVQTITFSGNQGKIPIAITNGNSYPLRVNLRLEGGKDFSFSDDKKKDSINLMPKENLIVYQVKTNFRGGSTLKVVVASGARSIAAGQIRVTVSDTAKYVLTAIGTISLILIATLFFRRPRTAKDV